jgi:hypothetical protein
VSLASSSIRREVGASRAATPPRSPSRDQGWKSRPNPSGARFLQFNEGRLLLRRRVDHAGVGRVADGEVPLPRRSRKRRSTAARPMVTRSPPSSSIAPARSSSDELVGHAVVNAQDEKVGNPAPVLSQDLRALSVQTAAALNVLPSSDSPAPCPFISRAGDPILEPTKTQLPATITQAEITSPDLGAAPAVPALIADLGYGPAKSGCVSSLSYSAATAVSGSHIRGSYFTVVRPSDDRPSSMVIKRSPWNAGLSSSAR